MENKSTVEKQALELLELLVDIFPGLVHDVQIDSCADVVENISYQVTRHRELVKHLRERDRK